MEIYLDANATTPVLPQARRAASAAMSDNFGNPSSIHGTGLRARAVMDAARRHARRALGAPDGRLLFVSGATEGIQTAVLSALDALRERRATGARSGDAPSLLLYGATEHKAVPEALRHWNAMLRLGLEILAIPVGPDGRHDIGWLRAHLPRAGLVCTMAANNETGVVTDLDAVAALMAEAEAGGGHRPLWLVDGVQALGKMALRLVEHRIDYAAFSGHKLYAPKGIGMLYVREGAPFTPLMAGGGQEAAQRSGTENTAGIAALGAVLEAFDDGATFRNQTALATFRDRLAAALAQAFPGLVFNAPGALCLPTTLNFSVPGLSSKLLLDLFDAADVRISGGSACSAAQAQPSHVLAAMGLPAWQAESAVRLSFGPAATVDFIDEACARIHACGESLRASCLGATADAVADAGDPVRDASPMDGLTRFVVDGACCYLVVDAMSRRCVVIDPLPTLDAPLSQAIRCRGLRVEAVLDTHGHGDHASSAGRLRAALGLHGDGVEAVDGLGWPGDAGRIDLGALHLTRLATPGHTGDSTAYLLHDALGLRLAFVGDTVMPGSLGRSDFPQSAPLAFAGSLRALARALGPATPMLPAHDYDDRFACTLAAEGKAQPLLADVLAGRIDDAGFAAAKAVLERDIGQTQYRTMACGARTVPCTAAASSDLAPASVGKLLRTRPDLRVIDVREAYEQRLGPAPHLGDAAHRQAVPLSGLLDALPDWLALPADVPVLFVCRSGNRSAQAAQALRRLGRDRSWSLAGGLALWPAAQAA